jgi:hypothetical protein
MRQFTARSASHGALGEIIVLWLRGCRDDPKMFPVGRLTLR